MPKRRKFRVGDRVRVGPDGPVMTLERFIKGEIDPLVWPQMTEPPPDVWQTVWFIQRNVRRARFEPTVLELAERGVTKQ